jgi:glutaredoxin
MAKEFLKEQGIEYTEFDVAHDLERRQEMIQKSGQMGVPVIIVGDEIIVGFDRGKLAIALDENAKEGIAA